MLSCLKPLSTRRLSSGTSWRDFFGTIKWVLLVSEKTCKRVKDVTGNWDYCSSVSITAFSGDQGYLFGSLLEFCAFPASRRTQDRSKSGELLSAINVLWNLKLDEDATVSVSLFPVFCWDPEKSNFLRVCVAFTQASFMTAQDNELLLLSKKSLD